jgi:hypothetical protein
LRTFSTINISLLQVLCSFGLPSLLPPSQVREQAVFITVFYTFCVDRYIIVDGIKHLLK